MPESSLSPRVEAGPRARLSRAVHFSSAYAYAQPGASALDNRALYGRWSAPDGLGCNFRAECAFEGAVDPLTGMVANLAHIDAWMKAAAVEFDHRDLRGHPLLEGAPATAEAIARAFHLAVQSRVPAACSARLVRTRLREGDRSWVEWGEAVLGDK